jgi:hypothetical protein
MFVKLYYCNFRGDRGTRAARRPHVGQPCCRYKRNFSLGVIFPHSNYEEISKVNARNLTSTLVAVNSRLSPDGWGLGKEWWLRLLYSMRLIPIIKASLTHWTASPLVRKFPASTQSENFLPSLPQLRVVVTSPTQFEFGSHNFNTLFQNTDINNVFLSMSSSTKWPFPINAPRKILYVPTSNNINREKQIIKCFCK